MVPKNKSLVVVMKKRDCYCLCSEMTIVDRKNYLPGDVTEEREEAKRLLLGAHECPLPEHTCDSHYCLPYCLLCLLLSLSSFPLSSTTPTI